MTVSAAKPEEKRPGWFVPTAVDQAESCVKPAAEGRNLARMPNPQHSETERLDHGPNWLKHTEDGLLLGECRLKVLTQNIDTGTPEGRLFFHMTAAFDEFQRELIVENTRAGLAAAQKRGRRGGRPPVMDENKIRNVEAMLKDTENYPFIGDVIDGISVGRTAFYRYFPPERIRQLRPDHTQNKEQQSPNPMRQNVPLLG